MSTPRHVVLSLGMPRSGTTLVQKMLEQGEGYFHQKVCEYNPWHPMNGPYLIRLVNTFRWKHVTVVRTTRPFDELWESLVAGREMGNPHTWTVDEFRDLCRDEDENWRSFRDSLPGACDHSVACRTVSFAYDDLGKRKRRESVLREIGKELPDPGAQVRLWRIYLDDVWMRNAVNVGRLKRRLT